MRVTVGELKKLLGAFGENNDAVIRVGSDYAARFDYLAAVGWDNDTSTMILYFDDERDNEGNKI